MSAEGLILGLLRLAGAAFHVGGVSALNRLGHAHYLPLGREPMHLWGRDRVPAWVVAASLHEPLFFHREGLFDEPVRNIGVTPISTRVRDWTLVASAPERAIMEVLSQVGESESSFTYASEHFEGLTSLRPKVVNELLTGCNSLKVKRLFLFLASHYAYPWSEKLDRSAIDLGKGKRLIVRGGRYDHEPLRPRGGNFGRRLPLVRIARRITA